MKRLLRIGSLVVTVALILLALSLFLLLRAVRPPLLERTEIYRGVHLTVGQTASGGRSMLVEVAWETPGVKLVHREYSYPFSTENPIAPHYKLTLPDWSLHKYGPAVLVNTTRYEPDAVLASLPGMKVRTSETVVVDGKPSHIHDHSYLIFWDADGKAALQTTKPPSPENLARAVTGFSFQGVQISEGRARSNTMSSLDDVIDRTFIGIDPLRNILFLMALEKATGHEMIDRALQAGVVFGGQVDSGSATTLLIGPGAGRVRAHAGIRNWRPLGPYLKIHAEPL